MHTSRSNKPNIAVTIGDPSGIGPEVLLKSLASSKVSELANFLIIGDSFVIDKAIRDMGLARPKAEIIDLSNCPQGVHSYGRPSPLFGRAAVEYIDTALELAASGRARAIVTGPVNKASLRRAGVSEFTGHTEYLARKTKTKSFAMMFVGRGLKVVPVTRHIALAAVAPSLSIQAVYKTIMLTHIYLRKFFKIPNPKIGVCGLNPHAGEGGLFGGEEKAVIEPAVKRAARIAKGVTGPIPADCLFYECLQKRFDAAISMYHDQGLAPFKMLYFKNGVNLTLGLPFIRTSPDHGTAFDIAGKGIADPTSMMEAMLLACRLARC